MTVVGLSGAGLLAYVSPRLSPALLEELLRQDGDPATVLSLNTEVRTVQERRLQRETVTLSQVNVKSRITCCMRIFVYETKIT